MGLAPVSSRAPLVDRRAAANLVSPYTVLTFTGPIPEGGMQYSRCQREDRLGAKSREEALTAL